MGTIKLSKFDGTVNLGAKVADVRYWCDER